MNNAKMNQIAERLKADGEKAVNVNRLVALAERFATPEAFFTASRGDLMKQFNLLHPGGERGLGKSFFTVFDKALRLWRAPVEDIKAKKAVVETAGEALASFMSQRITANELMSVAQIMSDNKKEAITMKHLLNTLEMLREEAS